MANDLPRARDAQRPVRQRGCSRARRWASAPHRPRVPAPGAGRVDGPERPGKPTEYRRWRGRGQRGPCTVPSVARGSALAEVSRRRTGGGSGRAGMARRPRRAGRVNPAERAARGLTRPVRCGRPAPPPVHRRATALTAGRTVQERRRRGTRSRSGCAGRPRT